MQTPPWTFLTLVLGRTGSGKYCEKRCHQDIPLLMSVVNWGEVFYVLWQKRGEEVARKAIQNLSSLSVQPVPVDLEQSLKAGEIKSRYKMSYIDSLVAALAMLRQGIVVTGDRDFEKLGRQAKVLWITRP